MRKICFPNYSKGEFASLAEAVTYLGGAKAKMSHYALCRIVQYNTRYRDHLRSYGTDALITQLTTEAPQLAKNPELLQNLREWAANETLADYDIQCYNIEEKVTILGHTFDGLKDIKEHTEFTGRKGTHTFSPTAKQGYADVHICEIYSSYPIFDSWDACDDRTYQNYIFSSSPLDENIMQEAAHTPHGINFCMVHEKLPQEKLPILYYKGEGKQMLLATRKKR